MEYLVLGVILGLASGLEIDLTKWNINNLFHELYGDPNGEYEIVTPKVKELHKRALASRSPVLSVSLKAFGEHFNLNLRRTSQLNEVSIISRYENGSTINQNEKIEDCLYHGELSSHDGGSVAISLCDGMSGIIRTKQMDYVVQYLPKHMRKNQDYGLEDDLPHVIYKRQHALGNFCGVADRKHQHNFDHVPPRQTRNAEDAEKLTVETAVFIDNDLYIHFKDVYPIDTDDFIKKYVLTVLNGIHLIYNHESLIDIPISFPLLSIHILKTIPYNLRVTNDADRYLSNFCQWQNTINIGDDSDPDHWDHSFIFTGINIKSGKRWETIGIAPMNGMCNPKRSCTLIEAKHFEAVFTGAHEAGHSFGMYHDGDGNDCDFHQYLMSVQAGPGQSTWSQCSGGDMQNDLSLTKSVCLLDERISTNYNYESGILPGQIYDATAQCKFGFGQQAVRYIRHPLGDICQMLKCQNSTNWYNAHPALEGTHCSVGSWCRSGECVPWGNDAPTSNNGGWGEWEEWKPCKSECLVHGTGITTSYRKCDNPKPTNDGANCEGLPYHTDFCDDSLICPKKKTVIEFANEQCEKAPTDTQPNIIPKGLQLLDDVSGGCIVWCVSKQKLPKYTSWGALFPDGTDCSKGKGRAYCIKGSCQRFS